MTLAICIVFAAVIAGVAMWCRRRLGGNLLFEVGILFLGWTALYAFAPILTLTAADVLEDEFIDARLLAINPGSHLIESLAWMNLAFAVGFAIGYCLLARGRLQPRSSPPETRSAACYLPAAWTAAIALGLPAIGIDLLFAAEVGSYSEGYTRFSHLPLLARQLFPIIQAISHSAILALVALLLLSRTRRNTISAGVIILVILASACIHGGRSEAISTMVVALVAWVVSGREISWRRFAPIAVAVAATMAWIGLSRTGHGVEALGGQNEFLAVFTTQLHMASEASAGPIQGFPLAARLGDALNIFPQQLLPFAKADAASWYMATYFPDLQEAGVGFTFGAISEGLVGAGAGELLLRGGLLGLILASVRNLAARRSSSIFAVLAYAYLCATCYLAYRNTTFCQARLFLYNFLPVLVFLACAAHGFARGTGLGKDSSSIPDLQDGPRTLPPDGR